MSSPSERAAALATTTTTRAVRQLRRGSGRTSTTLRARDTSGSTAAARCAGWSNSPPNSGGPKLGADEVSLQALQVDPQGVQNFFASRARAPSPLDLQVTFDTVSVQLERLITSHREMMASLQTVQAEQAVLKRESGEPAVRGWMSDGA